MALRLPTKFNRNFIQNLGKVFYSGKAIAKPVRNLSEDNAPQIATTDVNIQKNQIYGNRVSPLIQQVQTSSEEKVSEADVVQKNMQKNHLQPSRLAEFYQPSIDISAGTYPKLADSEVQQVKGASQYRVFEKSTTYKSVKLPLKKPKLVSPFPDPVKIMPSDTVSDQEKAELKEAEARFAKSGAKMSANFSQLRYYSSSAKDDKKCKKLKKKKKDECPVVKSPCKKPAGQKICEEKYVFKPCEKKQAPYQAYSEFCHTIPDEKPTECKMCPWKPAEHPSFKPPKKKLHTSSTSFSPRKRLHEKQQLKADCRKGWVEQGKWKRADSCVNISIHEIHMNALLCGNKPCNPPESKCKSESKDKSKSKEEGEKKGSKKKQKGKKLKKGKKPKRGKKSKKTRKVKKPQKKATTLDNNRSWITLANPESVQVLPTLLNHHTVPYLFKSKKEDKGKGKEKGSGNFKKFPFRGCDIKKPKPKEDDRQTCNKSKISNKRGVKDCPPETCKRSAPMVSSSFEYLLDKSKKPKCPKMSPGKCQIEKNDEPCGENRKGTTRKCPTDLLKKKRRKPITPKKKTQPSPTPSTSK